MNQKLFVSYAHQSGSGNVVLSSDNCGVNPPRAWEDIKVIERLLRDRYSVVNPIVLNWKVMK